MSGNTMLKFSQAMLMATTLLFVARPAIAGTTYTPLLNLPESEAECEPGQFYDDGYFIYECQTDQVLEAAYCIVGEMEDLFEGQPEVEATAITSDERITFDQEGALICEECDGGLCLTYENVTVETIAESVYDMKEQAE